MSIAQLIRSFDFSLPGLTLQPLSPSTFGMTNSPYVSAISGPIAVYGCYFDDSALPTLSNDAGAAAVSINVGGSWQHQLLTAPDATAGDGFGNCVAVDGNTIAVTAYRDDDSGSDTGSVYIFTVSGTTVQFQQKIPSPLPTASSRYGFHVSLSGDTLVVSSLSGYVYVYTRSGSTWSLQHSMTIASVGFGYGHAIRGDTLAVGLPSQTRNVGGTNYTNYGSVQVYTRSGSTWSLQQHIYPDIGATWGARFGCRLALDNDTLAIGSSTPNIPNFVYTRSGSVWSQEAQVGTGTILYSEGNTSIGLSGDLLVLPKSNSIEGGYSAAGRVSVFKRTGTSWSEVHSLTAEFPTTNGYFGQSAAISGNTMIVTSRKDTGEPYGISRMYTNVGL